MNTILKDFPWRRLIRVGRLFWVSEMRSVGLTHLLIVLSLLAANTLFAVLINKTAGQFMTALETRSVSYFYLYLVASVAALAAVAPVHVYYAYFRTRFALVWRQWLSNHLIDSYFADGVYKKLCGNTGIDNPPQRMTEDVDSFCNSSVGLFISILDAVVHVGTFLLVLWAISPTLAVTVMLYSALGLLVVSAIGKRMVNLNFQRLKNEADLRDSLTEVRSSAEEVALKSMEEAALMQDARVKLADVISTLLCIATVNRNIQGFTNVFNPLAPIIATVIIAPSYFANEIPFGTITEAVLAFTIVFNGATVLIGQFSGVTNFAAVVNRLGSLIEAMEGCRAEALPGEEPGLFRGALSGIVLPFLRTSQKT